MHSCLITCKAIGKVVLTNIRIKVESEFWGGVLTLCSVYYSKSIDIMTILFRWTLGMFVSQICYPFVTNLSNVYYSNSVETATVVM